MKDRLTYIDALRGFAISGVIITHAASIVGIDGPVRKITNTLGMGVQLFFVISAFTIFYSLTKSQGKPNVIRDFFIKRLFRIIPVYWMGIFLYTAVYGFGSRGWLEGPELWHYPMHFLLLNVLHPLTSSSVVPGGWSISCEVLFYAIVPILAFYIKNYRHLIYFIIFCTVFVPIANYGLAKYLSPILFSEIDVQTTKLFWYRWLPSQLGCFAFGMLLFMFVRDRKFTAVLLNKRTNLFLLIVVVAAIFSPIISHVFFQKQHVISFLFMIVALLLSSVQWKLLVNSFTIFMGKISYSCYLIHFLVIKQINDLLPKFFHGFINNKYQSLLLLSILAFIVTIPLAYLSYKFIETPAITWGRTMISYLNSKNSKFKTEEPAI